MDTTRWMQLRAAFEAAVDLPEEQRSDFAATLALDPDVRSELAGMLEADRRNEAARTFPDAGTRLHRLLRALAETTKPASAGLD